MERSQRWVAVGALATSVIAVIQILKSVPKTHLTIAVLILVALPLFAISIIVLYILFSDALSLITAATKKAFSESKPTLYISKRYVSTITTIAMIITILVFLSIKGLPDADKVMQTAEIVGNSIVARNTASLSKSMDNIIHTIIDNQKDPDVTRNRIYEGALKQAADKGYVFYIRQKNYYITAKNWRDDKRLLTGEETDIIEKVLKEIFERSDKRDQISLMNMVLSDVRVTKELWMPKERLVDLSPLDLIGIVGGYIGEHILEQ